VLTESDDQTNLGIGKILA